VRERLGLPVLGDQLANLGADGAAGWLGGADACRLRGRAAGGTRAARDALRDGYDPVRLGAAMAAGDPLSEQSVLF